MLCFLCYVVFWKMSHCAKCGFVKCNFVLRKFLCFVKYCACLKVMLCEIVFSIFFLKMSCFLKCLCVFFSLHFDLQGLRNANPYGLGTIICCRGWSRTSCVAGAAAGSIPYEHTPITFAGTATHMPIPERTNPIWQKLMSLADHWDRSNDYPQCTVRWMEGETALHNQKGRGLIWPTSCLCLACQVVC